MPKFDKYTLFTRVFPVIVAAAPAIAFAWAVIAGEQIKLVQAIAGIGLTVLLTVFADVARRRGKAIEPRLVERMGGPPSVTMLRHRDTSFNAATKARMHAFLAEKLAEPAPTAEQEAAVPETADDFYRRAGNWLRENTRSKKTLRVLFNDKIAYGYGRNLFALKWPALVVNVLIIIGSAAYLWLGASPRDLLPVFVLAFLHAAYLAIFSTWSAVEEASRIYARQLLLSTESTEVREQPLAEPGALAT